jgi:glutathione-S-conjugate glycine hydrolase
MTLSITPSLLRALVLAVALSSCAFGDALPAAADTGPVYWDTPEGRVLRARIPADADYWQLVPNFAVQETQSYCGVATAITVLNSLPIKKPVDAAYAPYAYFTQGNFFTPAVSRIISAPTVAAQGITREEMSRALASFGLRARSISGDALTDDSLRSLLKSALGDDGQFVLANYFRGTFGQVGGGHWSALAAYDATTDRVLILDVAKYKYAPGWVRLRVLRQSLATLDTTSGKPRGLVIVSP